MAELQYRTLSKRIIDRLSADDKDKPCPMRSEPEGGSGIQREMSLRSANQGRWEDDRDIADGTASEVGTDPGVCER